MNWLINEDSGRSESGQGMVEYGLILVLVSIVAIVTLGKVGTTLNTKFDKINTELSKDGSTPGSEGSNTDAEDEK